MPAPSAREKQIFLDAAELPVEGREAFLAEACGADEALRDRVRRLLEAHAVADDVLTPAEVSAEHLPADVELVAGERIAKYVLQRELGEGGFGTVWLAEQEGSIRRRVALKVIKAGMDTRQVIARFEAERQALALMDHHCIAKVFDGGATPAGRPFFAMELVEGAPITEYCDRESLGVAQRLELFLDVCRAVQHAHQKGVIHRDLKPSNVLVTEVDGKPVPKVIDFGIAKATEQRLTERTLFTEAGAFVGTPAYMSPEQVSTSADVDTRSDVYSLGVLLYELLCGSLPFDNDTFRAAGLMEIQRIIREVDPPKPSTRSMSRRIRGDLDWIVMRCLEKDRDRRYDSADVLANELERFLRGEPVLAGPPNLSYRMSKFVRRHRAALSAVGTIVAVLIGGIFAATVQAVRATNAERVADEETQRAQGELAKYEAIAAFLQDILLSVDPRVAPGSDRTLLRQILDDATRRVEEGAGGAAEVEATLRQTIGNAYISLTFYEEAEPQIAAALELRRKALGADDPLTLESLHDLGACRLFAGDLEGSEEPLLAATQGRRRTLGKTHGDTLIALGNVALLRRRQGRLDEAEATWRELLEVRTQKYGAEAEPTVSTMNSLAQALLERGQVDEAEELHRTALEIQRRTIGPHHPYTLGTLNNLGTLYLGQGRFEEAEPLLSEALQIKRKVFAPGHPSIVISMNNLAQLCERLGRAEETEAYYREALEIARDGLGEDDAKTLTVAYHLGIFLLRRERIEESEPLLFQTLVGFRRLSDPNIGHAADACADLLYGQLLAGETIDSEPTEKTLQSFPEGHRGRALYLAQSGLHHLERGRFEAARGELERAYPLLESDRDKTLARRAAGALAEACGSLGRTNEAELWRSLAE